MSYLLAYLSVFNDVINMSYLLAYLSVFNDVIGMSYLLAYLSVFSVFSQDAIPGEIVAI